MNVKTKDLAEKKIFYQGEIENKKLKEENHVEINQLKEEKTK